MIPLLIAGAVGAAAAGAGGAALAATRDRSSGGPAFGGWVDKDGNRCLRARPSSPRGGYDPNAYAYTGRMDATARKMYDSLGAEAQTRRGAQADYGLARGQIREGIGDQGDALTMLRNAANGAAPSAAMQQLQIGQDAAARSQEGLRAAARGASGVALADYNAAGNIAAGQQAANAQASMVRAQEMAEARGAFMGGANAARGQNIQAAGIEGGWSQFDTEQQMRQREMNDRRDAAMRAAAEGVAQSQSNLNQAQQNALQRAYEEQQAREAAARAGNNAATERTVGMIVGGASGAANAMGSAYSGGGSVPGKKP
ncbi:MAG: hypothetical protein IPG84_18755 [Betaproteobacteria bacterium]|nr:hypothetical protein [Betaproteobacteria bacterium]